LRIIRPHNVSKQELRDKIESELTGLLAGFGDAVSDIQQSWQGDMMRFSFRARGMKIKGTLLVADAEVVLDVDLPFMAKLFEGTIRDEAEKWLEEFLSPSP
jgi:hypothetical protein